MTAMSVLIFALVVMWSQRVLTQQLEIAQHSALMNVYDGLGSFALANAKPPTGS